MQSAIKDLKYPSEITLETLKVLNKADLDKGFKPIKDKENKPRFEYKANTPLSDKELQSQIRGNTQILTPKDTSEIEAIASNPLIQNMERQAKYNEELTQKISQFEANKENIQQDILNNLIVATQEIKQNTELLQQLAQQLTHNNPIHTPNKSIIKAQIDNETYFITTDKNNITAIEKQELQNLAQPKTYDELMQRDKNENATLESYRDQYADIAEIKEAQAQKQLLLEYKPEVAKADGNIIGDNFTTKPNNEKAITQIHVNTDMQQWIKNAADISATSIHADLAKLAQKHPEMFKKPSEAFKLFLQIKNNPTRFLENNREDVALIAKMINDKKIGKMGVKKDDGEVVHLTNRDIRPKDNKTNPHKALAVEPPTHYHTSAKAEQGDGAKAHSLEHVNDSTKQEISKDTTPQKTLKGDSITNPDISYAIQNENIPKEIAEKIANNAEISNIIKRDNFNKASVKYYDKDNMTMYYANIGNYIDDEFGMKGDTFFLNNVTKHEFYIPPTKSLQDFKEQSLNQIEFLKKAIKTQIDNVKDEKELHKNIREIQLKARENAERRYYDEGLEQGAAREFYTTKYDEAMQELGNYYKNYRHLESNTQINKDSVMLSGSETSNLYASKDVSALPQHDNLKDTDLLKNLYGNKQEMRKFVKDKLNAIKGKDIVNKDGIQARLSSVGIAKMSSDKAIQKSLDNGFKVEEHFEAVSNIENLFIQSKFFKSETPKNQSKDIKAVHRFIADNALKDKEAQALITLKESFQNGNRIYSLELEGLTHPTNLNRSPKSKGVEKTLITMMSELLKRLGYFENHNNIIPQTSQEIVKQARKSGKSVKETKELLQKHNKEIQSIRTEIRKDIATRQKNIEQGYIDIVSSHHAKIGKKGGYTTKMYLETDKEKQSYLYDGFNKESLDNYLQLVKENAPLKERNKALDNLVNERLEAEERFSQLQKTTRGIRGKTTTSI